ncbi:hypothetical protein DUNSADRAFT_7021 [Dunaliella salina]|uniref:Polyprenol reductase n=1 Tax=Dunaliella salina TaxID=3046 RepID=A0ABQ7FTV3_DUNSA|nr:hypothetical protein DUNSADRAFT_7021 [Dunaliella salina]|eukprot:KAF5825775.1 hypothetical protein DUNSADRAFT_7021 [Dunaliella salina]
MLRWHIHYNFLLLRLLSFAMDLHWARQQQQQQQQQQQKLAKQESGTPEQQQLLAWASSIRSNNPKARVDTPLPLASYSYLQHFVYCFYPPLYIAGPTITFNDFASQIAAPPRQSAREVLTYAARWLGAALLMEFMRRTLYFNVHGPQQGWVICGHAYFHVSLKLLVYTRIV